MYFTSNASAPHTATYAQALSSKARGAQFTTQFVLYCFTSNASAPHTATYEQAHRELEALKGGQTELVAAHARELQVLSLLALLVQKYK